MYENRKYLIINSSEIYKVNFNEILEESENFLRKSTDGTKAIVKWDDENTPSSILNLENTQGPYNHEEILNILANPEWETFKLP